MFVTTTNNKLIMNTSRNIYCYIKKDIVLIDDIKKLV